MREKGKQKFSFHPLFVLVFLLGTFLFFLVLLFWVSSVREKNEVAKIKTDLSLMDFIYSKRNDKESTYVNPPSSLGDDYYTYVMQDFLEVDMPILLSKNKDTKGYIQIEGTSFGYPFVLEKKKGYYQNHSYYQRENSIGWLYMDSKSDVSSLRNIILRADGKSADLFFDLSPLLSKMWRRENYLVKVSTQKNNSLWKPFSVYVTKGNISFVEDPILLMKRSDFPFDVDVRREDVVLTVVVRYEKNKALILHAKLMKKMERE